ncbi:hypothetical protein CHUAL_008196 [Chamberlinius hualienensis]
MWSLNKLDISSSFLFLFLLPPLLPNYLDKMTIEDDQAEPLVTFQAIIQSAVILLIAIAIIVSNLLVLVTLFASTSASGSSTNSTSSSPDVMTYYLMSLTVADLLCGALVVPMSIYPAMMQKWVYNDIVCRLEGYFLVTLWTVSVYTLMWIGVDRYLAIRKPLRYETLQTKTRCQCWMLFSWVTAVLLCSPPLLGYSKPKFCASAYVCMLDWSVMVPYSVTLIVMVLGPSIITICYTYAFVFNALRRSFSTFNHSSGDAEVPHATSSVLSDPYHVMSVALMLAFWVSWLPILSLHAYEQSIGVEINAPLWKFALTWLGVLNSFWKTLIYIFLSPHFRCSFRTMCVSFCCKMKARHEFICR